MTTENANPAVDPATDTLDSIDGLWSVVQKSGDYYDSYVHSATVGLFASEALADEYIALHRDAQVQVERDEHNAMSYFRWNKQFVPMAPKKMPNLGYYYIVETTRDPDTGQRDVDKVEVLLWDLDKEPQSAIDRLARENPGRAFQKVSKYDVEPEVILDSAEFPPLVLDKSGQYYEGNYETFHSFSKDAVVLTPPADYIHPEPIADEEEDEGGLVFSSWDKMSPETEAALADWERELLGLNGDNVTDGDNKEK